MISLVYGGSGSGKSDYAESLLKDSSVKLYLATMPYNNANRMRIERHRSRRADKGFVTIESTGDFSQIKIPEGADILLEDLPNLLADRMFSSDGKVNADAYDLVKIDLEHLIKSAGDLVVVSDDIFSSGMDYDPLTEDYMRILGQLHLWLAQYSQVTEVIAGIPVKVK